MSVVIYDDSCATCQKKADPDNKLNRCTGCRIAMYCSKQCQKADWKIHKKHCHKLPVAEGSTEPTQGVLLVPVVEDQLSKADLKTVQLSTATLNFAHATASAVAAKLGMPLKMIPSCLYGRSDSELDMAMNPYATALSVDIDPDSLNFGSPTSSIVFGRVLVLRENGQPLDGNDVAILMRYVNQQLDDMRAIVAETGGRWKHPKAKEVADRITPEAFKTSFEQLKAEWVAIDKRWESLKFPVE